MSEFRDKLIQEGNATLPIQRNPNYAYLIGDIVAVSQSPAGYIELAALSMQYRFTDQKFHVVDHSDPENPDVKAMGVEGETIMVENGAIRMSGDMAMQGGSALLEHLVKVGLKTKDDVRAQLRLAGLIDS